MTALMRFVLPVVCVILALSAVGCASTPVPSDISDLTPAEIFQKAQDASDKSDYAAALQFYKLFQEKFPGDVEHQVWASYEIAFLYHKMGDDKTALVILDELLARYAKGEKLPEAPRILAEKVKERIGAAAKPPAS
jgi:outer membrane protein assembly factor BamD (BamD/ComL family)